MSNSKEYQVDPKDNDDEFLFEDEDDELCFTDEDDDESDEHHKDTWKVLIVDDEIEIHTITERVLRNFSFEDKKLTLFNAYSTKEATEILQEHSDIAIILLDVVMEEEDAGLQLVELVREKFKNNIVRIILRTGQPGQAPEKEVIVKYDINDYQQKSELTSLRLFTVIINALRSYRDITNNYRLQEENIRMSAELDIARRLQRMVLPKEEELKLVDNLDIAGFMEPAEEVGGDYYEVLNHNGHVKIGIGDVTGHGLESGIIMLMVQTTVRALLLAGIDDPEIFLNIINHTIYHNAKRIETDKNLTLSLLDYQAGNLTITGQHEEVLIVRNGGKIERIDTLGLGFMIGIKCDISKLSSRHEVKLQPGDGVVLYTDGITEAQNIEEKQYSLERLCEIVSNNWASSAKNMQQAIITDVKNHIGTQKILDDITLLVLKQK
ncbi:MAG: SpoIIE family protein phosphatase [Proteobacteria bacterium]|nr:SpoIIE family protein phosphatase [Pseudomonadota bacterium]